MRPPKGLAKWIRNRGWIVNVRLLLRVTTSDASLGIAMHSFLLTEDHTMKLRWYPPRLIVFRCYSFILYRCSKQLIKCYRPSFGYNLRRQASTLYLRKYRGINSDIQNERLNRVLSINILSFIARVLWFRKCFRMRLWRVNLLLVGKGDDNGVSLSKMIRWSPCETHHHRCLHKFILLLSTLIRSNCTSYKDLSLYWERGPNWWSVQWFVHWRQPRKSRK